MNRYNKYNILHCIIPTSLHSMNYVDLFLAKFARNALSIVSTVEGCISGFVLFVINYIAGHETAICLILLCCIFDLVWAVAAAIKRGDFALSTLARDTVAKLSVYGTAIVMFIALDKLTPIDISITVPIVAAIIIMVEAWSFFANAIIVFPHLPILHLFRRMLIGEIAAKLHCHREEVEDVLEGMRGQQTNSKKDKRVAKPNNHHEERM